ncbi:hypothetical protein R3I94_004691 [Phoxinus phoxinus]
MQIFHPTSVYLAMVVLCSLLSSLAGVLVRYSREPVTKTEGHFVSLKCEVQYEIQNCDIVTNWYINPSGPESKPITNPNQYLISVNETEKGQFSGTEGKGHLLYLNVTADPYKGLKVSTWSGQLKADEAVLALSAILFLSRY